MLPVKLVRTSSTFKCCVVLFLTASIFSGFAQSCLTPPSGLIAWWPGDGNFQNLAGPLTLSSNGNLAFTNGFCAQSFNFDGTSAYLQAASPVGLPVGNAARSITLWFRTPRNLTSSTESALIQYGSGVNSHMFGLITSVNAPGKLYFWGYNADLAGVTTLQPNTWYFAAVTFNSTDLGLYLNGQLENSFKASGLDTQPDTNGLTIGLRPPGIRWAGQIDEIAIWNRALTSTEIQALYSAGGAGMCKAVPPGVPSLTVTNLTNSVTVSWPSPSVGFLLLQSPTLNPASWTTNNITPADDGTNKSVTFNAPTGTLFFRLSSP